MIVRVCHFVFGVKIVSTSESAPLFINLTNTVACPRSPRRAARMNWRAMLNVGPHPVVLLAQ